MRNESDVTFKNGTREMCLRNCILQILSLDYLTHKKIIAWFLGSNHNAIDRLVSSQQLSSNIDSKYWKLSKEEEEAKLSPSIFSLKGKSCLFDLSKSHKILLSRRETYLWIDGSLCMHIRIHMKTLRLHRLFASMKFIVCTGDNDTSNSGDDNNDNTLQYIVEPHMPTICHPQAMRPSIKTPTNTR